MKIAEYIKQINEQFHTGIAREHSYRLFIGMHDDLFT